MTRFVRDLLWNFLTFLLHFAFSLAKIFRLFWSERALSCKVLYFILLFILVFIGSIGWPISTPIRCHMIQIFVVGCSSFIKSQQKYSFIKHRQSDALHSLLVKVDWSHWKKDDSNMKPKFVSIFSCWIINYQCIGNSTLIAM